LNRQSKPERSHHLLLALLDKRLGTWKRDNFMQIEFGNFV